MDFTTYESFLENLNSTMRGINRLIKKAEDKQGKRFVWSPVAPDVVGEGTLSYIRWGVRCTDAKPIQQAILEHLDYDSYLVELVCIDSYGENYYFLFIGF